MLPISLGRLGQVEIGMILWRGEVGTTLFFVLSGFLLSLPYWRGSQERILFFMGRRLIRLWPALAVAIVIHTLVFRLWNYPMFTAQISTHLLLIHNLFEFSVFGISAPWWYLATQMQLYLAVPLVFWILRRLTRGKRAHDTAMFLVWVLCGLVAAPVAILLQRFVATTEPDARFLLADGLVWHTSVAVHIAQFATGIGLGRAYLLLADDKRRRWWRWAAPLAIVTLAILWPAEWVMSKNFWPKRPLLLAGIILWVSLLDQSKTARWLEWRPMRWLGQVSYGAFLYHGMMLTLVFQSYPHLLDRRSFMHHTSAKAALALGASLAMGALSYYAIERPILRSFAKRQRQTHPAETATAA